MKATIWKTGSAFTTFKLNNGNSIPCLGLGTDAVRGKEHVYDILLAGYKAGYRLIDSARMYGNEQDIGWALKKLEKEHKIPRAEFVLTSKILPADTSCKGANASLKKTLGELKTDYLDVLLIHWPTDSVSGRIECWKAMEEMHEKKLVRNIGVSNFTKTHLESLRKDPEVRAVPSINQIETNPMYIDTETIGYCKSKGILLQSYCPLKQSDKALLKNKTLEGMGRKYNKSVAQVVLRWHLQSGYLALPRTNNPKHLVENADIFDFELSKEEMGIIEEMNVMDKQDWDPHRIAK